VKKLKWVIILASFGFILSAWQQPFSSKHEIQGIEVFTDNTIVNKLSGKCMQVVISDGQVKGTLVELADCNPSFDIQQWEFTADSHLRSIGYDMCLDVTGDPGSENGSRLQVWPCEDINSNPAQKWVMNSEGYIQNGLSKRCIDVPGEKGSASGSILQIWDCEFSKTNTDQRWKYNGKMNNTFGANNSGFAGNDYSKPEEPAPSVTTKSGNLVNLLSNKCLDPVGNSTVNGTRVQITECDALADKFWELSSDGFLRNPTSGKCLDVAGDPGTQNSTMLQLWDCETNKSNTDQKWTITSDAFLKNLLSNRCADLPGPSVTVSGATLQLSECEYSYASTTDQRWSFKPAMTASNPYTGDMGPGANTKVEGDLDGDQISQAEETWIANAFGPRYIFDTKEPAQFIRFVFQVHPMTLPDGINQDGVVLTLLTLYEADWSYPSPLQIFGTGPDEFKYFWHWGDNEAVEIWLTRKFGPCGAALPPFSEQYNDPKGSARCYQMKRMILHSHEKTRLFEFPAPPNVMPVSFDGTYEDNVSLPGMRHPWVYISRGKHGAYIDNFWDCRDAHYQGNISLNGWIGFLEMKEFCSDEYKSRQAGKSYIVQFTDNVNVGELDQPLITWMDNHPILGMFAGENLWGLEDFCGGKEVVTNINHELIFWEDVKECAGSNLRKWCGDPGDSYCGHNPTYIRWGTE